MVSGGDGEHRDRVGGVGGFEMKFGERMEGCFAEIGRRGAVQGR